MPPTPPEGAVVLGGGAVVRGGAVVGVPELAQPAAVRFIAAYNICLKPAVLAKE